MSAQDDAQKLEAASAGAIVCFRLPFRVVAAAVDGGNQQSFKKRRRVRS